MYVFKLNTFFIIVLSNILSNILATKLKIDVSKLKEEKLYSDKLSEQSILLNRATNYKDIDIDCSTDLLNKNSKKEDFLVSYIITISFLKANTTLTVSDVKGNLKMFYSSGSVDLTGKQKKK